MCTTSIHIITEHFRDGCDLPSDSFLIGFSFLKTKQNKRFGFNLLVVIYGIFNFLVVVGMDRSEGVTQEMAVRNQKVSCVLWITEVTTSS